MSANSSDDLINIEGLPEYDIGTDSDDSESDDVPLSNYVTPSH